jgi:hypothetical protein
MPPPEGPPLTSESLPIVDRDRGIAFLVADETYLYFNEIAGPVYRADHAGGSLEILAQDQARHLTADATHVYWNTATDIRRVPKAGGPIERTAVLTNSPSTFAWLTLDESHVYCSTYTGQTVVRAPKTGGPPEVLASSSVSMGGIAVTEGWLYWAASGIHRLDLANGHTETVSSASGAALQITGDSVWFITDGWEPHVWLATLVQSRLQGGVQNGYLVRGGYTLFESDGLHMYWAYGDDLIRAKLDTGAQQLVATAPIHDPATAAFSANWIFVGSKTAPGKIVRIPKPPP